MMNQIESYLAFRSLTKDIVFWCFLQKKLSRNLVKIFEKNLHQHEEGVIWILLS